MLKFGSILLLGCLVLLLPACGGNVSLALAPASGSAAPNAVAARSAAAAKPGQTTSALTVGAAADLQYAFAEIGRLFEDEMGAKVTFCFGSSGTIAQQIENGAPIDLYASADESYVSQLSGKGLVLPDTAHVYAEGRVALVTYRASGLKLVRLRDLLRPEVKRVSLANPDHAPYGQAAKQALNNAGIWDQVRPKVVFGENVRQSLQFVQTGNADAGIVALSIANVPEVTSDLVDEALYEPLRQSLAVIKGTRQEQSARAFAAFVTGPRGRPIMDRFGFRVPSEGTR